MLNFNKLPEQRDYKKGKFIRPGTQVLILKDLFLQTSPNTGNERPVFAMETEPITEEGWEGWEGAVGQIGNIAGNFNYYLKTDDQKRDFMGNLRDIMKATGTYEAFDEKHGKSDFTVLSEVIEAVKPFIVGGKARYFVAAEQYQKLDNTGVGLKLKFPSKRLVESISDESKFPKFDETDPKHFKKLDKKEEKVSDLPF